MTPGDKLINRFGCLRLLAGLLVAVYFLASCGGGKDEPLPAPAVTIPDPISYLAQSRAADGSTATPLRDADPITHRRFDFGRHQVSDSFLVGSSAAITTWSYPPFGPYAEQNGDGGERYEVSGDAVRITHTKHLGIPTTPISWVVLTRSTVSCAEGWTDYNLLERGCRTTVTYPGIGPVDTVVSEHRHLLEPLAERIFLARGWGRLAWQAFRASGTVDDPSRCPDFGWNTYQNLVLVDCRYSVNVEEADGSLTGAMMWKP